MCFKIFGLHFQYVASIVYKYIVLQAAASCLKISKKIPTSFRIDQKNLRSSFYIWYFKFDLPVYMKESTMTVNLTLFRVFGTTDPTYLSSSSLLQTLKQYARRMKLCALSFNFNI
jgi:hypothetical protein